MAAESAGNTLTPRLHCATAADAPAGFAEPVVAVELDPVETLLVVEERMELLELEPLELPQPATSAVAASRTSADGKSLRIIGCPLGEWMLDATPTYTGARPWLLTLSVAADRAQAPSRATRVQLPAWRGV